MLGLRTKDGYQRLGSIEELGRRDGIVLVGIDGDIDKRLPESLDDGAAGGDCWTGHVRRFLG